MATDSLFCNPILPLAPSHRPLFETSLLGVIALT